MVKIFSDNRACFSDRVSEPAYSEQQERRELAGSCCTFKCMISRVKQQLGGGQICITPLRTPPEGTLASAVRSPIEIHPLPPPNALYMRHQPLFLLPSLPPDYPLPPFPFPPCSYPVDVTATLHTCTTCRYKQPPPIFRLWLCNHTMIKVIPRRLPIRDLSAPSATLL